MPTVELDIRQLADEGGTAPLAPITVTDAVLDENGDTLTDTLDEIKAGLSDRFKTISSGSIYDITEPGIYYLTSAVTNKPVSGGGTYIVGRYNDQTVAGVFVSAYSYEVFQIRQISGTGSYANITVETVRITGTTSSTGAVDIPSAHRGKRYLNALLVTGGAGFVIRRDASYFTVFNNDGTIKANTAVAFDAYFAF